MRPGLVIIDMQYYFFRSAERRVKLAESISSINELIEEKYPNLSGFNYT